MGASPTDPTIDCDFPNAALLGYSITSCKSTVYNCIAWAVGKTNIKWWPTRFKVPGCYWPPDVPRKVTVEAFVEMFKKHGKYEEWAEENDGLEEGYEKIAIYVDSEKTPTHAARQLECGKWASKIGDNKDIVHGTLSVLENSSTAESVYGRAKKIMRRPRRESPIPPACRLNPPPPCKPRP